MSIRHRSLVTSSLSAANRAFSRRDAASFNVKYLHNTAAPSATPLPYPTVPGPTPKPPQPSLLEADDRVSRKRSQLKALQGAKAAHAQQASPKPGLTLKKRFWKDVLVKESEDGLQIFLDARPIRTATKQILTLPNDKRALAAAIAVEWDLLVTAQQALRNHYIPLTSLAARAIDIQTADAEAQPKLRNDLVAMLMRYLTTDTLLCWAPERSAHDPTASAAIEGESSRPSLRATQIAAAEPIVAFLKSHLFPGLDIGPNLAEDSIVPQSQSPLTEQVIRGWLHGLPAFELAAVERGVLATKSLLVAIRLLVDWSRHFSDLQKVGRDGHTKFGIQQAAEACSVEVKWQTDMWGEVEDSHDVEKEDLARQLGSVVLLVS